MIDRRSHFRYLDCEVVTVYWNDGTRGQEQLGHVDDVSRSGMRLRVNDPISIGSAVEVSYGSLFHGKLAGTVIHHIERPEGLFLGLSFDANTVDPMSSIYPEDCSVAT